MTTLRERRMQEWFGSRRWRLCTELTYERESISVHQGEFWILAGKVFRTPLGNKGTHGYILQEVDPATGADMFLESGPSRASFGWGAISKAAEMFPNSIVEVPPCPYGRRGGVFAALRKKLSYASSDACTGKAWLVRSDGSVVPSGPDELFRVYYDYVKRIVGGTQAIPSQDVEDVAMDIMTRLLERDVIGMFDPSRMFTHDGASIPAKFRTFLTAQVSLYVKGQRDRLSRQRKRELLVIDSSSPSSDSGALSWHDVFGGVEDDMSGLDAAEWIRQARSFLATVPRRSDRDRCDLVRLFDSLIAQVASSGSVSVAETAAQLGVSPAVSGRWLAWLRQNLRQQAALSRRVKVGGDTYTLAHVRQAVSILQAVRGQPHVKQPLARAGNPLWRMEYHRIARYERATFPEVEVPSGDHRKPAPHVLSAVVHHLERVMVPV